MRDPVLRLTLPLAAAWSLGCATFGARGPMPEGTGPSSGPSPKVYVDGRDSCAASLERIGRLRLVDDSASADATVQIRRRTGDLADERGELRVRHDVSSRPQRGRPRMRWAITLRWISEVPPMIVSERA